MLNSNINYQRGQTIVLSNPPFTREIFHQVRVTKTEFNGINIAPGLHRSNNNTMPNSTISKSKEQENEEKHLERKISVGQESGFGSMVNFETPSQEIDELSYKGENEGSKVDMVNNDTTSNLEAKNLLDATVPDTPRKKVRSWLLDDDVNSPKHPALENLATRKATFEEEWPQKMLSEVLIDEMCSTGFFYDSEYYFMFINMILKFWFE
jgi:hypothetical protein